MARFDTPDEITVTIEVGVGDVRLVASERTDTVVEVHPSDGATRDDVLAAEQTLVEYGGGRLLVKAPRRWRRFSPFSDGGAVDVHIELPAGSRLHGEAALASLHCTGRLGDCRYKTAVGGIHLDQVGSVHLRAGAGDITVSRAAKHAEVTTGSGEVHLGAIDGAVVVKNSNGGTVVGEATGEVRVHAANGSITIDHAHAAITAKTANGDIRLLAIRSGSVLAETACGELELGICDGTAAWLDLHTHHGHVHNGMNATEAPTPNGDTVEVRARTALGDIAVHRRSRRPAPTATEAPASGL